MRCLAISLGGATLLIFALATQGFSAGETYLEQATITWQQAALSDGEALFNELCAVCHGVDARGTGPAAEVLVMPVPDITLLALHHNGQFPSEEVERVIRGDAERRAHGTREMPMWGQALRDVRPDYKPARRASFVELRVLGLTAYIESLQRTEAPQ